jgi:hypothetical protein
MGLKATFDPVTKIVSLTEAPSNGLVTIDVQTDLYSCAKEDWLAEDDLNKLLFLFRSSFGGQPLGGGLKAGTYYFMDNISGWRIKPYEADHELVINGNLFGTDPDAPIFAPVIGDFTVVIRLNTSQLTQGTTGLSEEDKDDIAERTRSRLLSTTSQSSTPVGGVRSHTP